MVLSACCRNARTTSVPEPQLCFPAPDSFSFIVSFYRESCLFFEKSYGVFCDELVQQELDDTTACIPIPDEIREYYRMYRPSPLCRAYRLEEALGTPAKIYYKFEGNNTSGSHKLNSAIAQAYYAKKQGLKGVTTETGAGQWGTALPTAGPFSGCITPRKQQKPSGFRTGGLLRLFWKKGRMDKEAKVLMQLVQTGNYSPRTAAKPASRSAMMSSMCSVPMDRRMVFW